MWTAKWILDAYSDGDESVRWDLYMTYPDLRSHFDELETRPVKGDSPECDPESPKPSQAWWSYCWRMVRG